MQPGEWYHSLDHGEPCRLVESCVLWDRATCLVWLPRRGTTVRVLATRLGPLQTDRAHLLQRVSFASAAARIADSLERDTLVAPLEGTVIPLPHQLLALQRAMSGDKVRYLLADEVGLGKTIEAGLILRELKIRGLVRRALVVAPAGLVTQWVSELKTHFGEDFRAVLPGSLNAMRAVAGPGDEENLWRTHAQIVVPLDSVKPLEARRGWTNEQLARHNRERFEDLASAGWDLIVIDEAHRLGGSTEQVARFKLGEALAQAAPYLLLLSATPHQGKSDSFRRLIGFLDPDVLPANDTVSREIVAPYVIRTEKRRAIDADGNPLFKPRLTQLVPIAWQAAHAEQQSLYEAVTAYVRDGYNRAMRQRHTAVAFLMILMQRLVTSSTAAIKTALERRLEVLELPSGQLMLFPEDIAQEWAELDGQEQMEAVLKARLLGLKDERAEVELLLSAARRSEARGPDAKAEALLDRIQALQREEGDPALKVLVFTEFIPTQMMLAEFLGRRGFAVETLNGALDMDERREVQLRFASGSQILVSTEAGGEGLNLQFCHVVVNYDLPWNPMKIEQRIGRVDRIGQQHVVRALNFALEGTVELRVREVLEAKLRLICEEFGVDKLSDVLDSEEGGAPFEELYVQAVVSPKDVERRASKLAEDIRRRAEQSLEGARLMGVTERLDPSTARWVAGHQLPYWTERMTIAYLRGEQDTGGSAEPDHVGYRLRWPGGNEVRRAVFHRAEAQLPGAVHLSLEDHRIRGLVTQTPICAPGQPVHSIVVPGVSERVHGVWSLWRVSLQSTVAREQRFISVFVSDDGRVLAPTARSVWDRLIDLPIGLAEQDVHLTGSDAATAYETVRQAAEAQGAVVFSELLDAHRAAILRERRKGEYAFAARRLAVERIGLLQVKAHRRAALDEEERSWKAEVSTREAALPDLSAVLLLRVSGIGVTS